MNPVEEIKSRLAIEDVIGEYVPLKKAGTNLKGLCPFHQEKTPSFMVSPEKQVWHCFGCSEGGDMFSFIQRYEGVEFRGALEILGPKAGVEITGYAPSEVSNKQLLLDIHEEAVRFYQGVLKGGSEDAKKTRSYLSSRGVSDASIETWGLGLSPDGWDSLLVRLEQKDTRPDIVRAGLVIEREGKVYDRFRRRLMFPIRNAQGKVVAFTARTLSKIAHDEEEHAGKYVNSPQTPVYNKSQVLYGFDMARAAIRRLQYVIIVEGNMDTLMAHQAGTENTVAVSGTALTIDQLQMIRRYTENIMLAFDADTAGSQAVFKGIALAWDLGMNVKVIIMRGGKDPADIIRDDAAAWKEAVRASVGVVDFYFEEILKRVDLSRADHKKKAAERITEIIGKLKTPVEQAHYIALLAKQLELPEPVIADMVKKQPLIVAKPTPEEKRPAEEASTVDEHLIAFVGKFPRFLPDLVTAVEPDMLSERFRSLYKQIIVQYTANNLSDLRSLTNMLDQADVTLWSTCVVRGDAVYESLTPREQDHEFSQLVDRIIDAHRRLRLIELTNDIRRAETEGRSADVMWLVSEYQSLLSESRKK